MILSSSKREDEVSQPAPVAFFRRPARSAARRAAFAAGAVLFLVAGAPGQTPQSAPSTLRYVNRTFGFELQTPGGWRYDRTGFFGPGGSVGVLLGASADGQASMQALVFKDVQAKSFPDWVEFFSKQLATITGIERVSVEGITAGEHSAAYVVADAKLGADYTRSVYYCVELDVRTILVVMYAMVSHEPPAVAQGQGAAIPEALRQLAGTLHVYYDPKMAEAYDDALERGRRLLKAFDLEPRARRMRIDGAPRAYLMEVSGKPVGYMTRRVSADNQPLGDDRTPGGKEGIRVEDETWRFGDDIVESSRQNLFCSIDGTADVFDIWTSTVPLDGGKAYTRRDQCVRADDILFSSTRSSADESFPEPREPIKVGDSYLGLAWARVLPALLGTDEGPMIAFHVYDTETRTLSLLAMTPRGRAKLPGGEPAILYESRDGYVERPTLVYADEYGNLLRVEAGDLVIRSSDMKTVESLFGARRERARQAAATP